MPLHLHRASRTDQLAAGLGELLAAPLADPFATEVVVVPTRGVERWLSQRLSDRLGVCAGVDFRSPWALFDALRGEDDPWSPDSILWPLMEAIDASLDESWAAPLARHLGHGLSGEEASLRRGRRFSVARRLSRLFSAYAAQRPAVIEDWSQSRDTDGLGAALPPDLAWQAPLWRSLAARIEADPPHVRHRAVVERLRSDPGSFDLPARLSLFGHTRLPVQDIELVQALGEHRDVHLWLPHPSDAMWVSSATPGGRVLRREDDTYERVGHPLLATLGRDVRELQRSLAVLGATSTVYDDPVRPDTLLGWLQGDLSQDAVRARRSLQATDRSVQVHACHGSARQVEVLREVLLGLLADDPTLEPRDIVVMCPDVEAYAPLFSAVFGVEGSHPASGLRVSLADRGAEGVNPLFEVLSHVLALADGRAGADVVLDLAGMEPVRRRFLWDDNDLETVAAWVDEAGIRWGFDVEHRAEYGLGAFVGNTWDFGLDRLAASVVMSGEAATWIDRTLPLQGVSSGDLESVGRLMEFVERLRWSAVSLRAAGSARDWRTALESAVMTLASPTDSWQVGHLQRALRERIPDADTELALSEVRALLRDAFAGRPTRSSFRTGGVTVCTMMPMRSVPHRVVCLVGLDDGAFPRLGLADGDDVLAREPLTGERDVRSEDRQLLLDAVMAATATLVITYTGSDVTNGQPRPPAVPLGELFDALEQTAVPLAGGTVRDAITVVHPLQPFDLRNVEPGALVPGASFSFDPAAMASARASAGPRHVPETAGEVELAAHPGDVSLDELVEFFGGPVRAYFRRRLEVALPREDEPIPASLPVEIDSLQEWAVGERILRDLLRGVPLEAARQREWRRGVLPPGQLGWRRLAEIVGKAEPVARETLAQRRLPARGVDIDIELGGGRRLRGTVPDVHGDRIVSAGYSRLGAKARLQAWVRLLALSVNDPDRAWSALVIGRGTAKRAASAATSQMAPLDHTSEAILRELVAIYDLGMTAPLPLPLKASHAYARARRTQADPGDATRRALWNEWNDGRFPGERSDAAEVAAWGADAPLPGSEELPRVGEEFGGEPTRFGALAMKVWSPLLDIEVGSF